MEVACAGEPERTQDGGDGGSARCRRERQAGRLLRHDVEGLRALDRYTVRFAFEEPQPRFIQNMATSDLWGAVAREVVEFYGDRIPAHPVGTGPFRLADWRRSSQIVLERNPTYRERCVRRGTERR